MNKFYTVLLFTLFSFPLSAQDTYDLELIQLTINKYFDGWLTGNQDLLSQAMHETCHLKFVRDGVFTVRNKEEYVGGFSPREKSKENTGRIVNIDITGNAAAAKVQIEIPGRLFTDYFNLLKDGDTWYITDKVSTSQRTE